MAAMPLWIWIVGGIVAIVALVQMLRRPGQAFWEIAKAAVLGLVGLYAVNLIGQHFHFHIGINVVTMFVAGLLGLP